MKSFDQDSAVALIAELVQAGQINLPDQQTYGLANPAKSPDDVIREKARVHALYLRSLLDELTRKDSSSR